MTTDRDLDRIARAWLADGPEELSDRVIDAAVDQIHLTRQRRTVGVPWRLPTMTTPTRVAAAAVIGVLVVGGTLFILGRPGPSAVGGGPAPTLAPTATPTHVPVAATPSTTAIPVPALTETFTSPRHGYSILLPAGWTATPAIKPWTTGIDTTYLDPALDALGSDEALLAVASSPLAKGQTAEQWLVPYCRSGADGKTCGRQIAIGDTVGHVDEDGLSVEGGTVETGGRVFGAAVVVDGRGYIFTLDGHVDTKLFEALLKTVTFDAANAIDTP